MNEKTAVIAAVFMWKKTQKSVVEESAFYGIAPKGSKKTSELLENFLEDVRKELEGDSEV